MKLTRTSTGQIIVTRQNHNGSQERIGELNTTLTLKEAKAKYHERLEEMDRFYRGKAHARYEMKEAIRRFNRDIVMGDA